jgi:hypothetical protein
MLKFNLGNQKFDFGPNVEVPVSNAPVMSITLLMEATSVSASPNVNSPSKRRSPRRATGSPIQRVASPSTANSGFQFSLSVDEINSDSVNL